MLSADSGLADLRFPGSFATSSGSTHSRMGQLPKTHLVDSTGQAAQFVQERIDEGADYIKIVADIPGPTQEILNALAAEARKQGNPTVAHAARNAAFQMAQEAKVDIVTHVPLDKALDEAAAELMAKEQRVSVPTSAIAEMIPRSGRIPGVSYEPTRDSAAMLHRSNVPIFAGTDSNQSRVGPVPHGEGLHHELELLTGAGLSPLEYLRAAT
jgi:imidazolonepropionase-like amidohydrolase